MRLLIAMMKHETNTFSPVPTPLGGFARFMAGCDPRLSRCWDRTPGLISISPKEGARSFADCCRGPRASRRGYRLRAHHRHDLRSGGPRRRRHHARSAAPWSPEDGGQFLKRLRAIDPGRSRCRSTSRQPLRQCRQCDRHHRLPHLTRISTPTRPLSLRAKSCARDPRQVRPVWRDLCRCCRMSGGRAPTITRTRNCSSAAQRWAVRARWRQSFTGFPHADPNAGLTRCWSPTATKRRRSARRLLDRAGRA